MHFDVWCCEVANSSVGIGCKNIWHATCSNIASQNYRSSIFLEWLKAGHNLNHRILWSPELARFHNWNHSLKISDDAISFLFYFILLYNWSAETLPKHLEIRRSHLNCLLTNRLHTWDWEPVTITLQALSLVEKAELVQVCVTQRLRDQRSMWM